MTLKVPQHDGEQWDDRDYLAATISDLVSDFLYYDRKEDEDLPRGHIEQMIEDEEVTVDEIIECFAQAVRDSLD